MKSVMFKNCGGVNVPLQPWPQVFYASRELFDIKAFELRPLTLAGLVKGVGKNLVTMNFWRLCYLLAAPGSCERWKVRRSASTTGLGSSGNRSHFDGW